MNLDALTGTARWLLVVFLTVNYGHADAEAQPLQRAISHQARIRSDLPLHPDLVGDQGSPIMSRQPSAASARCRTVFGYLPYWVSPAGIQWDKLTHLACFSLEINAQGNVTNANGWPWTNIINSAHAHGVKVQPVITLFDGSAIHTLLSSQANRQNLISNIKAAIITGDADGVNIDFEGSTANGWPGLMPGFLAELSAFLKQENDEWEVTIAGPAVNWDGAWDLAAAAAACDGLFIMGYDFYGSWSGTTGPSAPLIGGSFNVTNTLLMQYAHVVQNMPEKLILGVPYYGNRWTAQTSSPYSQVVAWLGWLTYAQGADEADQHGVQWDSASQTSWILWDDGSNWRQTWFDNADSLTLKYELAKENDLQGIGIWALGYDGTRTELWDLIQQIILEDCPSAAPGDLNGDGCVDQADLGLLLARFGIDDGGDINGDGITDQADLGLLLANWGSGC